MKLPNPQTTADADVNPLGQLGHANPTFDSGGGTLLAHSLATTANHQFSIEKHNEAMIKHQNDVLAAKELQAKHQDDALETATFHSQLREDWTNRLHEYMDNPTTDVLKVGMKEYDDYVGKMLGNTSNKDVKDDVNLKARAFRIGFVDDLYRLQTQTRAKEFGAKFDIMMGNAENSIYRTKSVSELLAQRVLIETAITDAQKTGRIKDPETIQALSSKADMLTVSWAEANLGTAPQQVIDALDGKVHEKLFDGVPVHTREMLRAKAENAIETSARFDKFALHQALESDIKQRLNTGKGESLNLDAYEKAFGKPAREAAARQLENSTKLHDTSEAIMGGTSALLYKTMAAAAPKADSSDPTYSDQAAYFDAVSKMVAKAEATKKDDPYTWFASNPVIKPYVENSENNPDNAALSTRLILEAQKLDPGMNPYDYKVMPKAEAQKYVDMFNKATAAGNKDDAESVQQSLMQFHEKYKDNISLAVNQLNTIQGGEKVTPKFNPLMWHLGNPSTFRLVLDAIRKDPSEAYARFKDNKVKENFLADVHLDANYQKYAQTIFSTNNGEEGQSIVSGVKDTYTAFARDYVLNGGSIKDASKVFFSQYTFGDYNGTAYARPRVYSDEKGVYTLSDTDVSNSDRYLRQYPRSLNPDEIDPSTLVYRVKGFTPAEVKKDMQDALRENTFWSTTEDETGVYLFTRGATLGTYKQILKKDGTPIRVNFKDTLVAPDYSRSSEDLTRPPIF
jgi:hypothetical protein